MYTINQYKKYLTQQLSAVYPGAEAAGMGKILLEESLGLTATQLLMRGTEPLPAQQQALLGGRLQRLLAHEPLQYVLGKAWFYGLDFFVDGHTLIPRPETEELVQLVAERLRQVPVGGSLLDMGTGSGCIAITLAKELPNILVSACDISEGALALAQKNAVHNRARVQFSLANILAWEQEQLPMGLDAVVSNPPYVRMQEQALMRANVLDHEPHLALFVDDADPLIFYRRITEFAYEHLKPGGQLFFEINEYLPQEMRQLVQQLGMEQVQLHTDLFGKSRMLSASRP